MEREKRDDKEETKREKNAHEKKNAQVKDKVGHASSKETRRRGGKPRIERRD